MNYATIKYNDIANGLGVRTSLFVSGCSHKCKGCFNSEAWDYNYGAPFTKQVEDDIIKSLEVSYVDGLSLLGGEPMDRVNQEGLYPFLMRTKTEIKNKNVWCYTGYLFEDLLKGGKAHFLHTDEILSCIDVLVDGKFILEQKNISLKFKGSENQRIIDVKKSIQKGEVVLFDV